MLKEIRFFQKSFKLLILNCWIVHDLSQETNEETRMTKNENEVAKAEFDKIRKMYECYSYLYENADDEPTRRKIVDLGTEHILAKTESVTLLKKMEFRMERERLLKLISDFKKR